MRTTFPRTQLQIVALDAPLVMLDGVDLSRQLNRTAQLLLIYLLTSGQTHRREQLAELFWPEREAKRASSNLRTVLAALRKVCCDHLVITRESLAIDPTAITYDVINFRTQIAAAKTALAQQEPVTAVAHWEAAVRLHQRPFLAGVREPENADLQLWLTLERELLYNQMINALHQLVDYYMTQGQAAQALPFAQRWLAFEPLDDAALQRVMSLLAQQGEPEAALAHYHAYLQLWQVEHDNVPPSPTLRDLVNAIVQGAYTPVAGLSPLSVYPAQRLASVPAMTSMAALPATNLLDKLSNNLLDNFPSNLPAPPTPLVGRGAEIDELRTAILTKEQRLITIVGLGGQGKTQLALAVASACRTTFTDGVWFVALEALAGAGFTAEREIPQPALCDLVANTIGAALGLTFVGAKSPVEQLIGYLHHRHLCLVLDNFEPLITIAPLLTQLLEAAPRLFLLVTSRVRLKLLSEYVFVLGGLTLPTAATPEDVTTSAAGKLFIEAAQRRMHNFMVTDQNVNALATLCQLTDGLPLALILASTWVEHLTLMEIVAQLQGEATLLSTDLANLPLRQQNLAQLLEASWQAIPLSEQIVLAQLSVFVEPFNRDAAQAVTSASLAQLRALTDQALLMVEGAGIYRFHPLIHHFAQQKLTKLSNIETPYATWAGERHAAYFYHWAQHMTVSFTTGAVDEGPRVWQGYGDIRAALAWHFANRPAAAVDLLLALSPLWERYGYLGEGGYWLQVGLTYNPQPSVVRAHLLRMAGHFAEKRRNLVAAKQFLGEALQCYEAFANEEGRAATLGVLGWVSFQERSQYAEIQQSLTYFEDSLQIYRALYNQQGVANQLRDISQLLIIENKRPAAEIYSYLQDALALYQQAADRMGQVQIWKLLGHFELALGNLTTAATYLDLAITHSTIMMSHDLAWLYHARSAVAYAQLDSVILEKYSVKALALFHTLQDAYGAMMASFFLGMANYWQRKLDNALVYWRESLRLASDQRNCFAVIRTLAAIGATGAVMGWSTGIKLGGASEALFAENLAHFTQWERADLSKLIAEAKMHLSTPLANQEWASGQRLSLLMAIDLALNNTRPMVELRPVFCLPSGTTMDLSAQC